MIVLFSWAFPFRLSPDNFEATTTVNRPKRWNNYIHKPAHIATIKDVIKVLNSNLEMSGKGQDDLPCGCNYDRSLDILFPSKWIL